MLSAPAGLEDVVDYADFKQEASVESMEDESTLEDEPDEQDLQDLMAGNIKANESRIIIISGGEIIWEHIVKEKEKRNPAVIAYP